MTGSPPGDRTFSAGPPDMRQGRERLLPPLPADASGYQATVRFMLDSSLMSPDASSRLSASGLRLKARMDIESSAPGAMPLARATLTIASSCRGVTAGPAPPVWRLSAPAPLTAGAPCPFEGGPGGVGKLAGRSVGGPGGWGGR